MNRVAIGLGELSGVLGDLLVRAAIKLLDNGDGDMLIILDGHLDLEGFVDGTLRFRYGVGCSHEYGTSIFH